MGIGGAVGLGAARDDLPRHGRGAAADPPLSRASSRARELFMLMTVGLASVAGTVFFLYASILKDVVPGALGHILIASMMSLPAAILIARIMIPGRGGVDDASGVRPQIPLQHGRGRARHRGRAEDLSADPGHADRDGGAGRAGRQHPQAAAGRGGRAAVAGAHVRLAVRAGGVAVRRAGERGRDRAAA